MILKIMYCKQDFFHIYIYFYKHIFWKDCIISHILLLSLKFTKIRTNITEDLLNLYYSLLLNLISKRNWADRHWPIGGCWNWGTDFILSTQFLLVTFCASAFTLILTFAFNMPVTCRNSISWTKHFEFFTVMSYSYFIIVILEIEYIQKAILMVHKE